MALTQRELEDCRNQKRRLDMVQTPQGRIAIELSERHKRQEEAKSALLKRCGLDTGAQLDENSILKYYK
ncbi:hypothetical protein [Merdimonas faecis]|uniref:hypothetical protein n=1 Tax=Merdimonas faecis TaxID=1653435 RepID=UPI0022DED4E1|nr:hypothetical protein [Merdimonas faecis]